MIRARGGMKGRGRIVAFALLAVALFMRLTAGTLTVPASDPVADIARLAVFCDTTTAIAGTTHHDHDDHPGDTTQDETWLLAEAADAPALVAAVLLFVAFAAQAPIRIVRRAAPVRAPPRRRWTSICPQGPPLPI